MKHQQGRAKHRVTLMGPRGPVAWDLGQRTAAQDWLTIIEGRGDVDPTTGKRRNPNGIRGKRRLYWFEVYAATGKLDLRQATAAGALRQAYDATQKTGPAIKEINVDSSPVPDRRIITQMERAQRLLRIKRLIAPVYAPVIYHVVIENRPINAMACVTNGLKHTRQMEQLRNGLDALCDLIERHEYA